MTSTSSSAKQPAKHNGWLKVTLAGSGIALTVLGTGLIAREAAGQTQTGAVNTSLKAADQWQPIPTVMPVPSPTRRTGSRNRRAQLQTPGQTGQSLQLPSFTRSRSSR